MFQSLQNYFASPPRRASSPLGAGLSGEEDDPAIPAFQSAWKDGALVEDMFGPTPFALHGSVGASGADNHRPDVAKVETFLGDAGYYKPMTEAGPSGWHNPNLDSAIRNFQKDKGLQVDGLLKPGGPTITAIGGLFGGTPQTKPQESGAGKNPWDVEDKPATAPNATPAMRPPSVSLPDRSQASGESVPVYGANSFMQHIPTQEAIDRYKTEYEAWVRENLDKIRLNEDLESRGMPTVYVPPPPRDPNRSQDDDVSEILRGGSGGYKPPRHPAAQQPSQAPTGGMRPGITLGGWGKPTLTLGGSFPTRGTWPDLFPGHTISETGAREHEDWARQLGSDSNPQETARLLNVAIKTHGSQGVADTADLLGRFAQHDPDKAETLRALVSRQAGREVPLRIAPLGEGFREPSLEEKLAQAPQQPFGSPEGADKEAAAGMAQALLKTGDYKDAYAYLKSAPEATPAYMAAVHDSMRQKNPELAMKFAEQGVENGMAKPVQLAQAETGIMSDGVPASAPPAQTQAPTPPVPKPAQTGPQNPKPRPIAQEAPQVPATPSPAEPEKTESTENRPSINKGSERIKVILEDKPAKFEIKDNPKEDGNAPIWRIDSKGKEAIEKYGDIVEVEATRQGVDPNLVKAIMYYENADGHKLGLNDVADRLGISGSVMPMNINPNIWAGLGIDRKSASLPENNIRAAVTLIKRIQERIDVPTPEKIGSLWNGIMLDQVNQRGARIGRLAKERPWEKTSRP